MKVFGFLVLILSSLAAGADSQVLEREEAATRVRTLIKNFGYKPQPVRVLLRSLIELEGKAVGATQDSFDLKGKGKRTLVRRVLYVDVLTFRGGGVLLNFIPTPTRKSYGLWDDINDLYPATPIAVVLTDGTVVEGWSNSATETHLVMTERGPHTRREIQREQIAAVYGLIGGCGGVKLGASKGAELGGSMGSARRDPLAAGVGAGIGAIIGALIKNKGTPILVFSR